MKLCGAQKSSSVHCVFLECNNADTTRQSHKADKNVLPEVATTWIKKIKKEKKHKYTGYKLRFPKLAELTPLEPFRFFFLLFFFHPLRKHLRYQTSHLHFGAVQGLPRQTQLQVSRNSLHGSAMAVPHCGQMFTLHTLSSVCKSFWVASFTPRSCVCLATRKAQLSGL